MNHEPLRRLPVSWGAWCGALQIGAPKDSVIEYETAPKADAFLVMARGAPPEIARPKAIFATVNPSRIDVHAGVNEGEPAALAPADG